MKQWEDFVVIVLDSFGVGAMEDVKEVRPRDIGSSTAGHIIQRMKPFIFQRLKNWG